MAASPSDDTGPVPTRLIFSIIVKVGTGPLFLCLICPVISLSGFATSMW